MGSAEVPLRRNGKGYSYTKGNCYKKYQRGDCLSFQCLLLRSIRRLGTRIHEIKYVVEFWSNLIGASNR